MHLNKNLIQNDKGFSLIELMVVLVIIGLLAGIVASNYMDAPDLAKQVQAKANISALESGLKLYKLDNGSYPTTEQGLGALVQQPSTGAPKWKKGGYLEKGKVPLDPWDNEYIYLCPGLHGNFDIVSYGKDGIPGGEDDNADINSWEIE